MNTVEIEKGILAIAISLAVLAIAVGSASAGCIAVDTGTDYGCGDTVVESCIFNENLECPAGVHGLIVGADGITIDGYNATLSQHFKITGSENAVVCQCPDEAAPEAADCGIYNSGGYDNVIIKNLEVENFCHGILLKGTAENKVVNNTLNSCKVHDNGNESTGCFTHAILLIYTINSTVNNNKVYNNTGEVTTACSTGGHGIKLFKFSNYNSITNNTIYGNAVAGIYAKKECEYNYVAYNEVYENGKVVGVPAEIGCVAEDGTVYKCGDMVVQSCTFNGDMSCPSGHGLEIGEDRIVIDGNEYCIDGGSPISHAWSGVYDYLHDNIVIKNLEVKHFRNGIYLKGSVDDEDRVENVTIENCIIHDNGNGTTQGIKLHYVCNSTIKSCEIYNNTGTGSGCEAGGDGIFLYDGSNNTFIYNNIYHNRKAGILIKMKPAFNNISYNELWENGQLHAGTTGGIVLRCKLCNHCIIEHNEVRGNLENGICIGGPDNIIRYNNVTQTKYDPSLTRSGGIVMYRNDGAYRNEVYDNNVTGNEQDGIGIREGCVDTYLHDNRVCENGIVEPSGYDIWSLYEPSTYGDENTCNTTSNYDDEGTTGCTYSCVPTEIGCVAHDGTVYKCGDMVVQSCTFNGDMSCPSGHGLEIGEDNIAIDGNGYCMDGVSPGDCSATPRAGIINHVDLTGTAFDNVVIKKLEIKNFCYGIWLKGKHGFVDDYVVNNTIDKCKVHDNGNPDSGATMGIDLYIASHCNVTNNEVYNNTGAGTGCGRGGMGIRLYGAPGSEPIAGYHTIINNKVYGNRIAGIYSKMRSMHNYVAYNEVYENGEGDQQFGGGIRLMCMATNNWVIEHNTVTDNIGPGILVGGSNNIIRHNTVTGSKTATTYPWEKGHGINICRCSTNNTLTSNVFCYNEEKDIFVESCCSDITGDENTCNTTDGWNDEGTSGCTYSCAPLSLGISGGVNEHEINMAGVTTLWYGLLKFITRNVGR